MKKAHNRAVVTSNGPTRKNIAISVLMKIVRMVVNKLHVHPRTAWRINNALHQFEMLYCVDPQCYHEMTRLCYTGARSMSLFGTSKYIEAGFTAEEEKLFNKHIREVGNVLVVGCSSGRETLPFARAGHLVYGIDYSSALIEMAKKFANRFNLQIHYQVVDIVSYVPPVTFNYILFTIYQLLYPEELRINILKKLHRSLAPSGLICINFQTPAGHYRLRNRFVTTLIKRKNRQYQPGDFFYGNTYCHHLEEKALRSEAAKAGFTVVDIVYGPYSKAVLRKNEIKDA